MLLLRDSVQLIVSDVDDTLAEVYSPAKREIIQGLTTFLYRDKYLFLISGQSIGNIFHRIVRPLPRDIWSRILVGSCSGAEVTGFDENGPLPKPFYSIYECVFSDEMKKKWRSIMKRIVKEYRLELLPTMTTGRFMEKYSGRPNTIMYEDRGAQITFEMLNAVKLSDVAYREAKEYAPFMVDDRDLRVSIIRYANALFERYDLPVTARLAGTFAVDFAIRGVNKTTAIREALFNGKTNSYWDFALPLADLADTIEIWGDKFSSVNGGTDLHMNEAFPPDVRAIDFRKEPRNEIPDEYNILLWDGNKHLCEGVIEYMKRSRLL